jgi:hypothetical protein
MAGVFYEYKIPMGQVQADIAKQTRHIEAGLNKSVDDLLALAANTQILKYTASANPAPPPASTYTRTNTLKGASQTRRTSSNLPEISGVWSVDESKAPYAQYVIGSYFLQSRIHRNRWKSKQDITEEVQKAAPGIIKKHIKGQL